MTLVAAGQVRAADAEITATSSREHLWFVADLSLPHGGYSILHHALGQADGAYTPTPESLALRKRPEALAAWDRRLWIVSEADLQQTPPAREVYSLQMRSSPAFGGYVFEPYDRFEVVASLPGGGRLAGAVGTAQGPVALLLPPQWFSAGVRTDRGQPDDAHQLAAPALYQLRQDQWAAVELPTDLDPAADWQLGASGADGSHLWIARVDSHSDESRLLVHVLRGDRWERRELPVPAPGGQLRSLTMTGSNLVGIFDVAQGKAQAMYLRDQLALPLIQWQQPEGVWAAVGLEDGLRIIRRQRSGSLTMSRVNRQGELAAGEAPMVLQPRDIGPVIHLPLLLAAGITAMLAAFLLRPGEEAAKLKLPPTVALASPVSRVAALAIDLLPGAVLSLLWLDREVVSLLQVPSFAPTIDDALPALTMIALTTLHSIVTEIIWGNSLGKAAFGLQVVQHDGSRPSAGAIVVRHLFRMVVLCIPLLAVFGVLNPQLKGLADTVARTVVVTKHPPQRPAGAEQE